MLRLTFSLSRLVSTPYSLARVVVEHDLLASHGVYQILDLSVVERGNCCYVFGGLFLRHISCPFSRAIDEILSGMYVLLSSVRSSTVQVQYRQEE